MRTLSEELKKLRGQPIEVITNNGMKICGIDVESDEDSVALIDDKGRFVFVVNSHIDALIEPQMKLERLCRDNDCGCDDNDER